MKKLFYLLLLVPFLLASCNKKDIEDTNGSIVGKWKATSYKVEAENEKLQKGLEDEAKGSFPMLYSFDNNNKFSLSSGEPPEFETGTYSFENGKLVLKTEGNEMVSQECDVKFFNKGKSLTLRTVVFFEREGEMLKVITVTTLDKQ